MNSISIWQIFSIAVKRFWIIALVAAVLAVGAFVYCENFAVPAYSAQASVISTNGGIVTEDGSLENPDAYVSTTSKIGSSDITSSINLVDTYVDILKTYTFYENLKAQPDLQLSNYTPAQLQKMTTIVRRSDYSMFIDIKITCSDSQDAITIANAIASFAPMYVQTMIRNSYVMPADRCIKATLVSPRTALSTVFAAFAGAAITLFIFVIISMNDNTVKSEDEIAERYNVSVLGIIPDFEAKSSRRAKK